VGVPENASGGSFGRPGDTTAFAERPAICCDNVHIMRHTPSASRVSVHANQRIGTAFPGRRTEPIASCSIATRASASINAKGSPGTRS
jgi:hypothetical protein